MIALLNLDALNLTPQMPGYLLEQRTPRGILRYQSDWHLHICKKIDTLRMDSGNPKNKQAAQQSIPLDIYKVFTTIHMHYRFVPLCISLYNYVHLCTTMYELIHDSYSESP